MVLPAALPSSVVPPSLQELAERIRPALLARQAVVPVVEPLAQLVPDGGLIRGSTVTIGGVGATSLALQLSTAASQSGSWVVVVGLNDLAPVAVLEANLDAERIAFIDPGDSGRHVDVLAALIGAVDVIVLDARLSLRPSDGRRLASRLRERGSILIVVSPGGAVNSSLSVDLSLTVGDAQWEGLGRGHGHLRSRHVRVGVNGRGRASRTARCELLLPAIDAQVAIAESEREDGTVVAFSR